MAGFVRVKPGHDVKANSFRFPLESPSDQQRAPGAGNYLLKAEMFVMHFPFAGWRLGLIRSYERGSIEAFDAKSERVEKFCLNQL
jgi:hypothetical protein